jgi:SurA N-terminal domain
MIENIRKYTGLTIVIIVILFISFLFLDSKSVRNVGGHDAIKIADVNYSDKELNTLGKSGLDLAYGFARSGDFGIYEFLTAMSSGATNENDAVERFFVSRMILRQAKEELGIYPGEDEISAYIKAMRPFAGADSKFDPEIYRNYIEKGIGRLGLTENDVRELASDVLLSKKITALIGSGLVAGRSDVAADLALENQQVSGELARLDYSPFEEKIQPTEEEIKAYWETIKDAFTTEPLRKFTYILVAPAPAAETKSDDAAETIADAAASEGVKKAAAKIKEEKQAIRAAALADARRKLQLEMDTLVDDFLFNLEEKKGGNFEELAKANGWELKTTELFGRPTPPKELALDTRGGNRGGKAVDELFKIQPSTDSFSKISPGIPIGENQWLVARLDGEEKSRPKTYAEARAEVRAQFIAEKATTAMKTAAEAALAKIKPLLTAGKSFADAAKEAGIPTTKTFTSIISTYRPDGASEPRNLFTAARNIEPNMLGEVVIESDRAFLLHVTKREVVKLADAETRLNSEVATRSTKNGTAAFLGWLNARIEAVKVEKLYKK